MNISQPVPGHVSVEFRRADSRMPKHFLDNAQIGTMLQQMGGKTVAEHVRRDVA